MFRSPLSANSSQQRYDEIFRTKGVNRERSPIYILEKNPFPAADKIEATPRFLAFEAYIANFNQQLQDVIVLKKANLEMSDVEKQNIEESTWAEITVSNLSLQFQHILGQDEADTVEKAEEKTARRDWIESVGKFIKKHYKESPISVKGFSTLILRAAFYLNNDEENNPVALDVMEDSFSRLQSVVSLEACAGGDYAALEGFCEQLLNPASWWQSAKEGLISRVSLLCSSGNQAHIPSMLNMMAFNKIKGDDHLFAASSDMMMEDVRVIIEQLTIDSATFVYKYALNEARTIFEDVRKIADDMSDEERADAERDLAEGVEGAEEWKLNLDDYREYFTKILAEKFSEHENKFVETFFKPNADGVYPECYFELYCANKLNSQELIREAEVNISKLMKGVFALKNFEDDPLLASAESEDLTSLIDLIIVINTYAVKNMPLPLWIAEELYSSPIFRNASLIEGEKIIALDISRVVYERERSAQNAQLFHQNLTVCLRDVVEKLQQFQVPIRLIGDDRLSSLNFCVRQSNDLQGLVDVGAGFFEIRSYLGNNPVQGAAKSTRINLDGLFFHPYRSDLIERMSRYDLRFNANRALILGDDVIVDRNIVRQLLRQWGRTEQNPHNASPLNLLFRNLVFINKVLQVSSRYDIEMESLLKTYSENGLTVMSNAILNHPNPAIVLKWIESSFGQDRLISLLDHPDNRHLAVSLPRLSMSVFKEFADYILSLNARPECMARLYYVNYEIYSTYKEYPAYRHQARLFAESIVNGTPEIYAADPEPLIFIAQCYEDLMDVEDSVQKAAEFYLRVAKQCRHGFLAMGNIHVEPDLYEAIKLCREVVLMIEEKEGKERSRENIFWQQANSELEVVCFDFAKEYEDGVLRDNDGQIVIHSNEDEGSDFAIMVKYYNLAHKLGNDDAGRRLALLQEELKDLPELLQLMDRICSEGGGVVEASAERLQALQQQDLPPQ